MLLYLNFRPIVECNEGLSSWLYTASQKNQDTTFLFISSSNINWFSNVWPLAHNLSWSSNSNKSIFGEDIEQSMAYWFLTYDTRSLLTINLCRTDHHATIFGGTSTIQRRLLWVGLHKEPSRKARLELFATNITVLEMRWQHVQNLGCRDAETARTITRGPSTWYNHVIVVNNAKPRICW